MMPAVRISRYRRDHPEIDRYRRDHPEIDIPEPVEGVWRAHIPLGGTYERVLAGRTPGELLEKLERAEAGG